MESTVYIACARAACYSCHLLVEATNDVEGRDKFRLGPFNGAIHCGWKFPSSVPHAVAVEKAMVTKIGVDLKQAIDECYKVREPLEFEWWPGS
ncbi:hypothetical protein C8T65DRAFT_646538 [Cerioporus squamosus]|nr:hypothetical protein C8T65DRAFT_646538 [Cerioporus squamosus]